MSDVKIQSIGVCGAGTMGSGIAQLFAQYGFRTFLYDINFQLAEKACEAILKNWNQLAEKGKITAEQHL
ncbi:MAG: 3-hydroxyacyl-CoA dehydrogenase NAD-binding domain-containing protein, partial [Chitinophagales bacterium]|nr:3-hydroxyacyl-CoA dehydrogenase NAD-binding domain-containing protein [Chitinophagales bacterium]